MQEEIYKNLSLEDLPGEEWRDVVGYEGLYQVSNLGRVKSLWKFDSKGRKKGVVILRQSIGKTNKYCLVNLHGKNGKGLVQTVHRIVAKAFLPNPLNKPCIDHINTIRTDNRICNIRWVTYSENCRNEITNKRMSDSGKRNADVDFLTFISRTKSTTKEAKLKRKESMIRNGSYERISEAKRKAVYQVDLDGNIVNEFKSIAEAQRKTGACHISDVCRGVRKIAGGYYWKFK